MKKTIKLVLALITSVSFLTSVHAGELTVTGTAKATYNITSGFGGKASAHQGKGIGVANEIDFGASGELDNGWAWNYQVQYDPGNTAASTGGSNGQIDDSQLTLTTNLGTFGIFVSEGGLDVDNAASQSVYGRPTDIGIATGMVDGPGIDSFNNVQYHSPAGLLPFGAQIKVAYASGQGSTMNSSNAVGNATDTYGTNAAQYQVSLAPIEGLTVKADYYNEGGASAHVVQQFEAGSVAATYKTGPFGIGYSKTLRAPLIQSTSSTTTAITNNSTAGGNADSVRLYTSSKMSAAYAVNENFSISYEREKSNRELIVQTTEYDITSDAIQAAYTMGGMTIAVSHGSTDNVGYANTDEVTQTLFAVTMAF
jgi:hypothetical protein